MDITQYDVRDLDTVSYTITIEIQILLQYFANGLNLNGVNPGPQVSAAAIQFLIRSTNENREEPSCTDCYVFIQDVANSVPTWLDINGAPRLRKMQVAESHVFCRSTPTERSDRGSHTRHRRIFDQPIAASLHSDAIILHVDNAIMNVHVVPYDVEAVCIEMEKTQCVLKPPAGRVPDDWSRYI